MSHAQCRHWQAMIDIAHFAEIVEMKTVTVPVFSSLSEWRSELAARIFSVTQGDADSGAGKVTSSPCASGRSGTSSVAADSSSRTASGDGQIIGQ